MNSLQSLRSTIVRVRKNKEDFLEKEREEREVKSEIKRKETGRSLEH